MAGYGTYKMAGRTAYLLSDELANHAKMHDFLLLYSHSDSGDPSCVYFEPYKRMEEAQARLDEMARNHAEWLKDVDLIGVLQVRDFHPIAPAEIVKSWKIGK